jgi:hypothetical protein
MFSHLISGFPESVTLTETYHDKSWLEKAAYQTEDLPVNKHIRSHATKTLDRLGAGACSYGRTGTSNNKCTIKYVRPSRRLSNRVVSYGHYCTRNKDYACYQYMHKSLRAVVMAGCEKELDLAKAHPRILASLLGDTDKVGKFFKDFTENAEDYYAEIWQTCGVDCPTAKNLINSACYGGTVAAWMERENVAIKPPEFACRFTNNIVHARNHMLGIPCFKDFERLAIDKRKAHNRTDYESTFMAYVLGTIEARIILHALDFLRDHDIEVHGLNNDAVFIASDADVNAPSVTKHVREKTGLGHILFEVKDILVPTSDAFISDVEEHVDEIPCEPLDDKALAKKVVDLVGSNVIRAGDTTYGYNCVSHLWTKGKIADIIPQQIVTLDKLVFKGIDPATGKMVVQNLGASRIVSAINMLIPAYIPYSEDFLTSKYRSTYRKIKFRDGVYDIESATFRPSFDPSNISWWRFRGTFRSSTTTL